VGLRVDLDRQRSHEKVGPPPRVCRPPLPPCALAVIARRAEVVVLSAERGWAEVGVCLSLVSQKATAWNRGVEGPDVKVLDARSVQGCARRGREDSERRLPARAPRPPAANGTPVGHPSARRTRDLALCLPQGGGNDLTCRCAGE
jgi:hypothetical protein